MGLADITCVRVAVDCDATKVNKALYMCFVGFFEKCSRALYVHSMELSSFSPSELSSSVIDYSTVVQQTSEAIGPGQIAKHNFNTQPLKTPGLIGAAGQPPHLHSGIYQPLG